MGSQSQPIECPYKVGAKLAVELEEKTIPAVIKKTFTGGENHEFSNSCTVLVDIEQSKDTSSTIPKEVVLKIFDWRYSTQFRTEYNCPLWTPERRAAYKEVSAEDRTTFEEYLAADLPESGRTRCDIRNLCQDNHLPARPTNLDIYSYAIDPIQGLEIDTAAFVEEGLIPALPTPGYEEIFLEHRMLHCLAAEEKIASLITEHVPGRMPRTYGIGSVKTCRDDNAADSNDIKDEVKVYALLMEKAQGQNLVEFIPSLQEPGAEVQLGEVELKELIEEFHTFLFQLWRCNLQLWDHNKNNFIIRIEDGKIKYAMVDFGALVIVQAGPKNYESVTVSLQGREVPERLIGRLFQDKFDEDRDEPMLGLVVAMFENIMPEHVLSRLCEFSNALLTQFWKGPDEFEDEGGPDWGVDYLAWQAIMLHVMYSSDQRTAVANAKECLEVMRFARNEMLCAWVAGPSRDDKTWWLSALRNITKVTKTDFKNARRALSECISAVLADEGCHDTRLWLQAADVAFCTAAKLDSIAEAGPDAGIEDLRKPMFEDVYKHWKAAQKRRIQSPYQPPWN